MTDKTSLDGEKLMAAHDHDVFAEVGLHRRKNRIDKTLSKKSIFIHVGMHFITPMHLLLFLMLFRYGKQPGRNNG